MPYNTNHRKKPRGGRPTRRCLDAVLKNLQAIDETIRVEYTATRREIHMADIVDFRRAVS